MNEVDFYMLFVSNLIRRAFPLLLFYIVLSAATWIAPPLVAAYWREMGVGKYLWSNMCFCLVPIWLAMTVIVCVTGMKGMKNE